MSENQFLAFDFGAESGRAIIGSLKDEQLSLEEIHRFPTGMLSINNHFHWNIFRLFEEMKKSMSLCAGKFSPESMAVDTWGVDYALLTSDGTFLGLPFAYRDSRNNQSMSSVLDKISKKEIYDETGIQFFPFNSIFQLYAHKLNQPELLNMASDLLFMPDIFNYLFSGVKVSEFSYATTSQLYNPITKCWSEKLFKALDLPISIMQKVVQPGDIIGEINKEISKETGINPMKVVAVASHDTGSAVAAVPCEGENQAYISSGTWSLMGIEIPEPLIHEKGLQYNFTNEGGVNKSIRFLKNIMGMWLLQQCKKSWSKVKDFSYPELVEMSMDATPFSVWVDPDHDSFMNPVDMPTAIKDYCINTKQQAPSSYAGFVRCILESLAFKYRYVLEQLKELSGRQVDVIHIIGGGSQNKLLCQYTANATGLPVIAGPVEGTAIGNLLIQAQSAGYITSLEHLRQIVRNSFELDKFQPENTSEWEVNYQRFVEVVEGGVTNSA